jgi:hypothetical protein
MRESKGDAVHRSSVETRRVVQLATNDVGRVRTEAACARVPETHHICVSACVRAGVRACVRVRSGRRSTLVPSAHHPCTAMAAATAMATATATACLPTPLPPPSPDSLTPFNSLIFSHIFEINYQGQLFNINYSISII